MQQILHVVVVGFHHKKGCQVDFAYPPLQEVSDYEGGKATVATLEVHLPPEWSTLPSLALPDGAHNTDQDVVYFVLPSRDEPGKSIFGISCYRQISSHDLLNKAEDVTRSTVQKSVCVLTRVPLYGVLKAKLQLITQAYFNERDFAKEGVRLDPHSVDIFTGNVENFETQLLLSVDVLSQMYGNLCEMFEGDLLDGQGAFMDISVRDFIRTFRHRSLLLFKLILLERKIVFHLLPVQRLSDTLVALLSLFPKLLEEGLFYSSSLFPIENLSKAEEAIEAGEDATSIEREGEEREEKTEEDKEDSDNGLGVEEVCLSILDSLPPDPIEVKDSYGFPLSIYTLGNLFHPYVGLGFMEPSRSTAVRAYTIGCTNALFLQRKDFVDVVVTIDESGAGIVDIIAPDLRRALVLTTADLRFADFVIKNVEGNEDESAVWEGGDEWCRVQFRSYLLSLASSARSGLVQSCADFGTAFMQSWRSTVNYQRWIERKDKYEDLSAVPPGHAFAGNLGMSDVMLRMEHLTGSSEQAKKAFSAISSTGKSLGETGIKVKSNLTSWLRGVAGHAGQAFNAATNPTAYQGKAAENVERTEEEETGKATMECEEEQTKKEEKYHGV